MSDSLVQSLLEELLESGRTVEDVCAAHPQVIDEVRARWRRLRRVQDQVDELFPAGDGAVPTGAAGAPAIPGYAIERELGRGGMGIVYRARQLRLDRSVALKMMLTGPFASPRELQRFHRETQLVAQLQHPNIVAIHDVGDVAGQPFFTMELVDGPSLAERLRQGRMPVGDSARLTATLAHAVEFAHRHGIVHRDLKPSNILLADDGTPKISDFGLAQRIGTRGVTITGAQVGTPGYMAPEQAAGDAIAVGPATDVHALGIVLYEMLTGRSPFRGDSEAETTRLVLESEPRRPRALDRGIPRDLETICLQCLRKDPTRRYATAALLAQDLERFLRGEPIQARRVGALERLWLWSRRRRGLAAALGIVVLLLLALLAVSASLWVEHSSLLRSVEDDLRAVHAHSRGERWTEARAAHSDAVARLGDRGSADLHARLDAAGSDLQLVEAFERLRLQQTLVLSGRQLVHRPPSDADARYAELLRGFGVADPALAEAAVAAAIAARSIRTALVQALDDWAGHVADAARRDRLLAIARLADPDRSGWRDRLRDAGRWNDLGALRELAADPEVDAQPGLLVIALADRLRQAGGDALPLLERTLARHPNDFRLNQSLGLAHTHTRVQEAIRYFQAAVALRPEEGSAHAFLGIALSATGRLEAGEERLRHALTLRPGDGWIHANLGNCLLRQRRHDEALAAFERSVELAPDLATGRIGVAATHLAALRDDAAMAAMLAAEAIAPDHADVHSGLGVLHKRAGKFEEAVARFERALRVDPRGVEHHYNLSLALRPLGRFDAAVDAARAAVALDPGSAIQRSNLGQCLRDACRMEEAIAVHREAAAMTGADAAVHHELGMALAFDWQFAAANAAFAAAVRLDPAYDKAQGGVAQTLLLEGRFAEAVDAARRYVELATGDAAARAAAMLQEAERLLAVWNGAPEPSGGDVAPPDRLYFARRAAGDGRDLEAVQWYQSAFADAPRLAVDVRGGARLHAVVVALRTAATSDEPTGSELRDQARRWLADDLAFRRGMWPRLTPPLQRSMTVYATRMLSDPALAGVRDAVRLAALPAAERNAWIEHWGELDAWLRSVETR